jgi:cell wall-associated NlpC family hydrolase
VRRSSSGRSLPLAVLIGALALGPLAPASADPDPSGRTPTKSQVDAARQATAGKQRDVAAVQTDLLLANQRLQGASIKAAQASEAYNAARWKLQQARKEARAADGRATRAEADLAAHQESYGQVIAATYEMSPGISTLSALVGQDGIDGVVQQANTMFEMTASMDDLQMEFEASQSVADLARKDADAAKASAATLEAEAAAARTDAESQEAAALAQSAEVAREKDQLLAELADLQHISLSLATRRQTALELAAQQRAADAAATEDPEPEQAPASPDPAPASDPKPGPKPDSTPKPDPTPDPKPEPDPAPAPDPEPAPEPAPAPAPDPAPPAPSASGAQRAIAFARDQIGEPYRWAAAGPGAWDCSGLTMKAWQAGGKYLPHYSVGQYDAATPIRSSQLRPGDLVFWGSSSNPSSIFHVALYIGGGRMIHAPRTGRPVTEESMYYWTPPNFFARP